MQRSRSWGLLSLAAALSFQSAIAETTPAPASPPTAAVAPADDLRSQAVEAAIWGMPIVSVDAMREAYFRDAGARYNDIVYWSHPADWRNQTTTPNSTSLYVYFNFNLKDGPVAVDIPPAGDIGIFGSILDAWQAPRADIGKDGEDHGKGGRYLLLPPGFDGAVPADVIPVRVPTNNGYALFRMTPKTLSQADVEKANAVIRKLRVANLSATPVAAPQRFIKMDGKLFDGIVRFDDTFFQRLARMVSEEPPSPRDADTYARLRAFGIEPGKAFSPDPATRALLRTAAEEARSSFRQMLVTGSRPWWPGSQWGTSSAGIAGAKTAFTFYDGQRLDTKMRGAAFFLAYALPRKLGKATFYLTAWRDVQGQLLDGSGHYRLRVPPHVPAREFWAINVYDSETAAFLRRTPRIGLDSLDHGLQHNADGSVDIYFGPQPPKGKAANWVYTEPGKQWFASFRLYGPEPELFDKTWSLDDIVRE
ncbi:hypothetical protein ASL20_24560 [Cupriavidus necator]|uniref:DUF1254 domain-containing protein n=1 Tax=Cupriavidus necator TaxID=106590 RepID=UPI00073C1B91|nr:DUF1254 domain-containing protein [Cupriavidus necator]KUE86326.1 hypothetical protein ASL20_24560 [Cupriavidus necator]